MKTALALALLIGGCCGEYHAPPDMRPAHDACLALGAPCDPGQGASRGAGACCVNSCAQGWRENPSPVGYFCADGDGGT